MFQGAHRFKPKATPKKNGEFLKLGNNYFNKSSILSIICKDYSIVITCNNNFSYYITINQSIQIITEDLACIDRSKQYFDNSSDNFKFIEECKKTISNTIQKSE